MAKAKRAYVCNDCGADFPRWQGQCNACGAWNTITEVRLAASPQVARNEETHRLRRQRNGIECSNPFRDRSARSTEI